MYSKFLNLAWERSMFSAIVKHVNSVGRLLVGSLTVAVAIVICNSLMRIERADRDYVIASESSMCTFRALSCLFKYLSLTA